MRPAQRIQSHAEMERQLHTQRDLTLVLEFRPGSGSRIVLELE